MFRRLRRRILRWLAASLALGFLAAYAAINLSRDDPARWHLDPAAIALRGTPNDYLAAVPGTTAATPHLRLTIHPLTPQELLACVDRIARSKPRVAVVAGNLDELMITYMQRSKIVGFPDYITVRAVPRDTGLPEGAAALIVYSRSRYGHGDLGVNAQRIEGWMKEAGAAC
jgi:uncharacterized protein (DUF1499 family)